MHRVSGQLFTLQNQSYSNAIFFFFNMEIWMITRKTNHWDAAQLDIIKATKWVCHVEEERRELQS